MKPTNIDNEHLAGKKFSNGYAFNFSGYLELSRKRTSLLADLCAQKKIIHFGCADHVPLINDKIRKGSYLHSILEKVSGYLVGLDSNSEAVSYMKENCGFNSVYCFDLFKDKIPTEIKQQTFDYLILGEVLEHIDNPVFFLEKIKEEFSAFVKSIVITVPNLASIHRFKQIRMNFEFVNSDHRFWFTPYTLSKVVTVSGLKLSEIHGTDARFANKFRRLLNKLGLQKLSINDCDTLVALAHLNQDSLS